MAVPRYLRRNASILPPTTAEKYAPVKPLEDRLMDMEADAPLARRPGNRTMEDVDPEYIERRREAFHPLMRQGIATEMNASIARS